MLDWGGNGGDVADREGGTGEELPGNGEPADREGARQIQLRARRVQGVAGREGGSEGQRAGKGIRGRGRLSGRRGRGGGRARPARGARYLSGLPGASAAGTGGCEAPSIGSRAGRSAGAAAGPRPCPPPPALFTPASCPGLRCAPRRRALRMRHANCATAPPASRRAPPRAKGVNPVREYRPFLRPTAPGLTARGANARGGNSSGGDSPIGVRGRERGGLKGLLGDVVQEVGVMAAGSPSPNMRVKAP